MDIFFVLAFIRQKQCGPMLLKGAMRQKHGVHDSVQHVLNYVGLQRACCLVLKDFKILNKL